MVVCTGNRDGGQEQREKQRKKIKKIQESKKNQGEGGGPALAGRREPSLISDNLILSLKILIFCFLNNSDFPSNSINFFLKSKVNKVK